MASLMSLPIETRLTIFRYVIPEHVVHEMPSDEPVPINPSLSLLLVSSTINAEVCLLPTSILAARFRIFTNTSSERFHEWAELPRGQSSMKV